ncbi:MAG: hypothetical protein KKA65_04370 [Nanoarchaeota archaeon]|nr:hypothetical protein [Nanoarchaeota archaeon]MBU4242507.1 hypothetical protein [Nanoarchaeota archaeon]MBU4351693.1 hypothetical protein [Nanoarchaeota archaeon]MBU4456710.1 hypothetical protein [Nanoarchaeota archaeon]MCG2719363.1 hypothetical protein [Nanoarchaeota archaeon]
MDYEEQLILEEKESPVRKIIIFILSILLILMFLSYIVISFGVGDIIGGWAESSLIEGNSVEFNNGLIVFSDLVLEGLNEIYSNNKNYEFKVCLGGSLVDNVYSIDEIVYPRMYSQKYNLVVAEPCPLESLIDLHSHPLDRCIASQTDMENFSVLKLKNPDALMVIMCQENRINVYS